MCQQGGYYIYYERNESMQNYMVSLRAAERHPEEFEADRAAHQFREILSAHESGERKVGDALQHLAVGTVTRRHE